MPVGATSYFVLPLFSDEEPLQGRPRFIYNAGEIALDKGSPEVNCCRRARKFCVYLQDGPNLLPRGICCRNCNAEYLDATVYNRVSYQESEVEVICMETSTDLDHDMENSFCKSGQFVISQSAILKRKRCNFEVNRYFAFMSMAQPHRRYINHKDPRAIDELRPGDHIAWHRSYLIWHHQLICENKGNGKCCVIHFNRSESSNWRRKAEVKYDGDFDFTSKDQNGTAYKVLYDDSTVRENPVDLVFDRANSRLLEQNYNIFANNCEHFVTFCKTGKQKSIQTIWLCLHIILSVLRAVILCDFSFYFPKYFHGWLVLAEVYDLIVFECFSFLSIGLWNQRLYRKMVIGKLDRNRRIMEITLEKLFTICLISVNIGLLYAFKTFISEGGWKILTACVLYTIVIFLGKITGCLAGNHLSQFVKTGIGVTVPPRERPPMYGAVTVNS